MPLPTFDIDTILASFPSLDELTDYGLITQNEVVRPGRLVSFSTPLPNGMEALSGWSAPEAHGRWNDGDMAELAIDVGENLPDGLCCELLMSGYLPLKETVQRIPISDGTADPIVWTIDRPGETLVRFPLRTAAVVDGRITLTFRFPNAVSPASLGKASDTRRLAVTMKLFRIRSEDVPLTDNPMLRLATSKLAVPSVSVGPGAYRFVLDEVTCPVRLISRVSHTIDRKSGETELHPDDLRALGVAVERIVIQHDGRVDELAADDPRLTEGWWQAETIGDRLVRWTDGAAVLPVALGVSVTVELHGVRAARYAPEAEIGSTT